MKKIDKAGTVPKTRLLFLAGGGLALLAGLNGALLRLGLTAPVPAIPLRDLHGVLMLYGFLGTAILLERAVAIQSSHSKRSWSAYVSPALSGIAVLLSLVQVGSQVANISLSLFGGRLLPGLLWSFAYLALLAIYVVIWRRQQTIFILVQALGALAGLAGIALWTSGAEVATIVPWWLAFVVLTIIGERLELARIAFAAGGTETRVLLWVLAFMLALVLTLYNPPVGYLLLGVTLAAIIVDVGSHDVALRTIRSENLPKFIAAAMLSAYCWALLAAGIWIVVGPALSGAAYDVVVHALTIGFGLSMVMAHAPIIVPAIVRRSVPYSPVLWVVWGLLQLGLAVRVIGVARADVTAWQFGGAVDVLAVLAFVGVTFALVLIGAKNQPASANRKSPSGKEQPASPTTGIPL